MDIVRGKTKSGFDFEIDKDAVNDMRFLDMLAELEEKPLLVSKVCLIMLGKEQKDRLYAFLEDENGRVPAEKFSDAIAEIFDAAGENDADIKN